MKTLIELYDDRPLENMLAVDVFRPETVVYLCSDELIPGKKQQENMIRFLKRRGIEATLVFRKCPSYETAAIVETLGKIRQNYPDCALDITGGTDSALFASGMFERDAGIPVFTYSRKKRRYFNILNAAFAEAADCALQYSVEEFFLMAGGCVKDGRYDNRKLSDYLSQIRPFFNIYLEFRKNWHTVITWFQQASQELSNSVHVRSSYYVRNERGTKIPANEACLARLQEIGFLCNLKVKQSESVEFDFLDMKVRSWLRDIGAVLELYTYLCAVESRAFTDVETSVIVDWEGSFSHNTVTNEIDVMTSAGVFPVFISCKACDIRTEALNELAILRDRFGGEMAKAAIVTTTYCSALTEKRAEELGITVIDIRTIRENLVGERLKSLAEKR